MKFKLDGSIIFKDKVFTNNELNIKVDKIKSKLNSLDLKKGEVVGLLMSRSPILIISIFALLDYEIPFLPLDYSQPEERIKYMVNNAKIRYVLADDQISIDFDKTQIQYLSKMKAATYKKFDFKNEIAYILYTSGSTGRPKAVEVTRLGLKNFIYSIPFFINFSKEQSVLCHTNCVFDIFFLESILALHQGLTVVLASEEERINPRKISKLIQDYSIDIIQMTPSVMKLIQIDDNEFKSFSSVRTILVGGEAFPQFLLKELQEKTNARLFNMYGPTEATIWSTISELTNKENIDIGYPIHNTEIFLLDENMDEVEQGVIGEICIAGDGLARGYLNNEEQTKCAFKIINIRNQLKRIYKTGDYGQMSDNNELLCLGRKDNQIKFRGNRIELDEIDNLLSNFNDNYLSATCLYQNELEGELITFYVASEEIENSEFINYLSAMLPEYMIPRNYIKVEQLYYTSSGKVDRNRLLNIYNPQKTKQIKNNRGKYIKNDIQKTIIQCMKFILNDKNLIIENKSRLDNIGFSSMSFIKLIVELEECLDIEFDDTMLNITAFEDFMSFINYVVYLADNN
ncbi:non-ribosomal peptide synthetase [Anaerocolumna jejuensis]|uniref:non-ribosomal peptide synthetase n=1 Tax=Anaerocolumna jejuensis TaxID=259063 RepID=UPI003F7B4EC7